MRRLLALALVLAGCPRFDEPFGCASDGSCPDGLACAPSGVCCPLPSCEGRCGRIVGACGVERACPCEVLYVDEAAPLGGTGAEAAPLLTITEALAKAREAGARRVQLAPGSYGAGETFPIELRGLELAGAGPSRTRIEGGASVTNNALFIAYDTTLLVGDATAATTIRDLELRCSTALEQPMALLCDRGTSGLDGAPTPNTFVRNVTVTGPCASGIAVVGSVVGSSPTGCSARLEDVRVSGAQHGVFVGGACRAEAWVTAELLGGEISNIHSDDGTGYALYANDCTRALAIDGLHVHHADVGVDVWQRAPAFLGISRWVPLKFTMSRSRIECTKRGVGVFFAATAELEDNHIVDNLEQGIILTNYSEEPFAGEPSPAVTRARRNVIRGNGVGIAYDAAPPDRRLNRGSDWGNADEDGQNVIACNTSSSAAGDLLLGLVSTAPGVEILAMGNAWDHAPPTRMLPQHIQGIDVAALEGALIRTERATTATVACATPGP